MGWATTLPNMSNTRVPIIITVFGAGQKGSRGNGASALKPSGGDPSWGASEAVGPLHPVQRPEGDASIRPGANGRPNSQLSTAVGIDRRGGGP